MLVLQIPNSDELANWGALIVGLLAVIYLLLRPRLKKKDPLASAPAPRLSLAQQRDVEQQMQSVLIELSEMARQISGQLDTRALKLQLLIKDADDRLARLSQMGNGQASAAPAGSEPPVPVMRVDPIDPRHAAVYALSDQGKQPLQIAQELSRPRGEIELILALRDRSN